MRHQTLTPTPDSEDTLYYRRILHELIDLGADLARHLHRQATTQPATSPAPQPEAPQPATQSPDPILALDRVARMVRRSILLARTLNEPAAIEARSEARARNQVAARKRIIRDVEDTIHRQHAGAEAEAAHAELQDRLDAPDLEDEIDDRPIGEIVKDIVRDLGLADFPGAPAWTRRSAKDIERLCARAAARPARTPAPKQPIPLQQPTRHQQNQVVPTWPPETRRRKA